MCKIKTCKRPGFLKGGIGAHMNPRKVNQRILAIGTKIEMEHTNNKCAAMWIAIDHIREHGPAYYPALIKMEKRLSSRRKRK